MKNNLLKILSLVFVAVLPFMKVDQADAVVLKFSVVSAEAVQNIFTPSTTGKATCATDVTTELTTFANAHSGYVTVRSGDCLLLSHMNNSATADLHLQCAVPKTCTIEGAAATGPVQFWENDNTALDSKTLISAIGSGTINTDDTLPNTRLTVGSVSGYHVGDYVKIADSTPVARQFDSGKTISGIADNGSTCVITTSTSHGYSTGNRILLIDIVGTSSIGALAGAEASVITGSQTGVGRTYNITKLTNTTFSLNDLNNTTDAAGSPTRCATGSYTSGGKTHKTVSWASEASRVAGIDTINKYIYLTAPLQWVNLYVQQPVLYRYTQDRKFSMRGFIVQANGDTSDVTISNSDPAVDVGGVPEADIEDNTAINTWDAFVMRRGTPGSKFIHNVTYKLPNRGTFQPSAVDKTITDVSVASQAVFTSVAHGFSNGGNGIFLSGMPTGFTGFNSTICRVSDKTNDTFKCKDTYGNYLDSSAFTPAFSGTATAGSLADVTGLGYGISDNGTNFESVVDDLETFEGRHSYTTGASQMSWSATLGASFTIGRYGAPTYLRHHNIKCHAAYGVCMDDHEEDAGTTDDDLLCDWPVRGPQFGSYSGMCYQERGKNKTVRNLKSRGGRNGLILRATSHDSTSVDRFYDIDIADTMNATNVDTGLNSEDETGNTYKRQVYGYNWMLNNVSIGADLRAGNTVTFYNLYASDYGRIIDAYGATNVHVFGGVSDLRTNTHTSGNVCDTSNTNNCLANMRSDVTNGGPTVEFYDFKSIKGSNASMPLYVFNEHDTAATKYYKTIGFTEENPSAVTQTVQTSSGATTLTELTTMQKPFQLYSLGSFVEGPTNKTYPVVQNIGYAGTIVKTKTKCTSGTATVTFKVNSTSLSANSASSSGDSVTQSSSNTFVVGDTINEVVSSNSSCVDLQGTIDLQRVPQ